MPPTPFFNTTPRAAKVSLCMIVRNEEDNLPSCLQAAAGLCDELIVVDTGSNDQTKSIAQRSGARTVDFPWIDDFAAARNAGIDLATGSWVFWLDADDRINEANRRRLKSLFQNLPEKPVAYLMEYSCLLDKLTHERMRVDQARLFPNAPGIRWKYRVHEQIVPSVLGHGGCCERTDIAIDHLGYSDSALRGSKDRRNLRLLQKQVAETPIDPFVLFNLGWTLLSLGQPKEAAACLESSLRASNGQEPHLPKLYNLLAQTQSTVGDALRAISICKKGREAFPDDCELLFTEAMAFYKLGDFRRAATDLERLTQMNSRATMALCLREDLTTVIARHHLAIVYRDQGRFNDAETEWRRVLTEQPEMRPALVGLAELVLVEGRWLELEDLCKAIETLPDGQRDAGVLRARSWLARNDYVRAQRILEPIVHNYPTEVWPLEILSRVFLQSAQWPQAERALCGILLLDPNHNAAKSNLTRLLLENQERRMESNRPFSES